MINNRKIRLLTSFYNFVSKRRKILPGSGTRQANTAKPAIYNYKQQNLYPLSHYKQIPKNCETVGDEI